MEARISGEVTVLLQQIRSGDSEAAQKLIPLVVDELRSLARMQLRKRAARAHASSDSACQRSVFAAGKRPGEGLAESRSLHRGECLSDEANSNRTRAQETST
jgi:hypothetical protein